MEEKKISIKFNVLAIIAIIIFCFALAPKSLQNDTFYTIKVGEQIVNNGIDMQDHFSWHENLPYTYPHWAYDCGIYFIYNLGQMSGIADGGMLFIYISTIILSAILGILLYYANNKFTKNKPVSFIITLIALYLVQDFIAARAQLVTFILFILTIIFIEKFLENKKKRYLVFLVLIATAIANIHSAVWPFFFILFLPYIAEYIIAILLEKKLITKFVIFSRENNIRGLEKKLSKQSNIEKQNILKQKIEKEYVKLKNEKEKCEIFKNKIDKSIEKPHKIKVKKNKAVKWLILTMVVCIFTGFLTPIGDTPYTYLIKTMQGNTTASISEHLPLTLFEDKGMMISLALFLGLLIFTDYKIKLRDLFMFAGLTFLLFMSRRQTSMFILVCGFIFAKMLTYLTEKYSSKVTKKITKFMASFLGKICILLVVILLSFAIYKPKMDNNYINESSYPVQATEWIKQHLNLSEVKLYNEYNFGSYLLFKEVPVFIDSRADLYAPEFNGMTNEEGKLEGRDIFSDYINTASISTYYENKFENYGITHVIISKKSKLNMFLSRNDKYKELYSDEKFVIYERNV